MDDKIDRCMNGCMRRILPYCLIAWNWMTDTWENMCKMGVKTLRAIEHAQKDDIWIFFDANQMPYHAKHDWPGIPDNGLVFYSETKSFLLHNRIIPTPGIHRFDIVSAELSTQDSSSRIDCTSFFLEVSWRGLAAPSLVEMIHLFGTCVKGNPYSSEQINQLTLHIMDSDGEFFDIPLNSVSASQRFTGWT